MTAMKSNEKRNCENKKLQIDQSPYFGKNYHAFQYLMPFRVRDILLVSSVYDSFILAQDGQLNELILSEFLELNLFTVPAIHRVSSGSAALSMIEKENRYDLIITTTRLRDMKFVDFVPRVRELCPNLPIVLLSFDNRELNDLMKRYSMKDIERTFLWQGDISILLAIVKSIEDKWNLEHDTTIAGVHCVIVIEDNIRFYSSFLPTIYSELMKHSHNLISEGINLSHKIMRMRARPKIILCCDFEEAEKYFSQYKETVLGIVSDVEFPKDGKLNPHAGMLFAELVRKTYPDVPIILQSTNPENASLAEKVEASFLLKNSPTLLHQLRGFMIDNFGFGDFVFRTPDGREVGRAKDLKSLERLLRSVPVESIRFHAERNHYSKWLKARTEFLLAEKLRPQKVSDFESIEDVRRHVISALHDFRSGRSRGVIHDFDRYSFDRSNPFSRIGGGSLGGKARGLAFISSMLSVHEFKKKYDDVSILVPESVVLGTDIFDGFLEKNDLMEFAIREQDENKINRKFQETGFDKEVKRDLLAFLKKVNYPLAVRSSSLLEDSQYQPFSGIYRTFMLPNNHPDVKVRLKQLIAAVKRVYASTFSHLAKVYFKATPYRLEEEKMAVIIQRLIGSKHGKRFYPTFSGVARSYNYYPSPPMSVDDGIAAVALGFGQTVVEGGNVFRFCPKYPHHPIQYSSVNDLIDNSQKSFYALDLPINDANGEEQEKDLTRYKINKAYEDGVLAAVGSVYSPQNDAVYDRLSRKGVRFVSFRPVLKHNLFPLAEKLEELLELVSDGVSAPVEIEFAVDLSKESQMKEFGFLQMRPLIIHRELEDLKIGRVDRESLVCRSSQVLGNGKIDDIRDVIIVDRTKFDRAKSVETAREVDYFNAKMIKERKTYILIGVGRWGSADPWLGIPVQWDNISGARVIVETGFKDLKVSPSQGSHFFQNITTFNIGFFTIKSSNEENYIDWPWLLKREAAEKRDYTAHLVFSDPLIVKMNGFKNSGVIFKPGLENSL